MKNLKLGRFSLYLLSVFLITAYVYQEQCFDIVLIEYLRHYFFDIGRIDDVTYQIQFVNEGTKVIIVTLQSKKNILIFMKTNMYTLPTFQNGKDHI